MREIENPFKTDIDVDGETLVDDILDSYYRGFKGRLKAKKEFAEAVQKGIEELSVNPDAEAFILKEINLSVSQHDNHVVKTVFHAAVSAYASPLNVALRAESGSGKSYSTTETLKFLPPEDVKLVGSQSPKVISHENGILKTEDGRVFAEIPEPAKPEKSDYSNSSEYDSAWKVYAEQVKEHQKLRDNCHFEVDLRNKIWGFLESVNPEAFRMLKATMSHDSDFIDHKFVDDHGKIHVTRLIGAPVLIFNSLDNEYVSEFATRTLTITPNTTKEKIEASMEISNRKSCYPWNFNAENLNKTVIIEYLRKVRDALKTGKIQTVNPFLGVHDVFSKSQVRDMRDFNKFLELLPSFAMVKLFQRPIIIVGKNRYLVPTINDFLEAKALFDSISETTKTGTEQRILCFYWDCVAKHQGEGVTVDVLTEEFNQGRRKQKLSSRRIRQWLDRLVEIEFVDGREGEQITAKGYADNRKITYHPLKQKNSEIDAFSETATNLKAKLSLSFDLWLKSVEMQIAPHPIQILHINGKATEISTEEFVECVRGGEPEFISLLFKPKSDAVQENKSDLVAISETATIHNSFNPCYLLAPNDVHPCQGSTEDGKNCPLEAKHYLKYQNNPNKGYFCREHFAQILKQSIESGYKLEET